MLSTVQICTLPFSRNLERRAQWIAAINRKDWGWNKHNWIRSAYFLFGVKTNDLMSPDHVPSVFRRTKHPVKGSYWKMWIDNGTAAQVKKKRVENSDRLDAEKSFCDTHLSDVGTGTMCCVENSDRLDAEKSFWDTHLSDVGIGTMYCEPHTGLRTMTYLSMADKDSLEKRSAVIFWIITRT